MRWMWLPALLAAAVVYAALDSQAGIRTWLGLRRELRAVRVDIAAARAEIARLGRDGDALESDPLAVERVAREDLGLAKPGETVVRTAPTGVSNPRFP